MILLVALCWASCDGLASYPGRVVILLVALCWASCDGLASYPGRVVILLVTLCWVSCDGLASYPGRVVILLVALCWASCDGLASYPGRVVILLVTLCWVSCDGLAPLQGGVVILLVTLCWVSCDGLSPNPCHFRLTLLWYHAVIRPFVALDEGSNEEGTCKYIKTNEISFYLHVHEWKLGRTRYLTFYFLRMHTIKYFGEFLNVGEKSLK